MHTRLLTIRCAPPCPQTHAPTHPHTHARTHTSHMYVRNTGIVEVAATGSVSVTETGIESVTGIETETGTGTGTGTGGAATGGVIEGARQTKRGSECSAWFGCLYHVCVACFCALRLGRRCEADEGRKSVYVFLCVCMRSVYVFLCVFVQVNFHMLRHKIPKRVGLQRGGNNAGFS